MNNLSQRSIPAILKENVKRFGSRTAISCKRQGEYVSLSYEQFYHRVLMAARGLRKAGMQPGDKVAIFSENRLGWAISDFAIQSAQGITVPIYATNTGKQAAYVINHCAAKIVFVSTRSQYAKLLAIRDEIPNVELVVSYVPFLGDPSLPVYTQYQLSELSHPLTDEEKEQIESQIDSISPKDLITIIYTSGTTGVPKGVMLTQENILYDTEYGVKKMGGLKQDNTFLSFLPLSHVLERTAGYYAAFVYGNHIAFAEDVKMVMENMTEVKPTVMVSVPRLFEKIHSRIYENVHQMSTVRRKLFHHAVDVGKKYVNLKYVEKRPTGALAFQYQLCDRLVFKKIRNRFGGNMKFFLSGGAPLDKTINEFMWVIGIPVFGGYGLTETSPAITLSSLDEVRFDSVGKVLEQTEVKLAEDGELMVKGPQVMQGYYRNEEATLETMEDGWLKTGDIATIDDEGFVYIVDRKKEIIVTAGGKNIAPQPLENGLKLDKYISQAMVIGDRRPYLVALITPNVERLIDFGRDEKLDYIDIEELVTHSRIKKLYEERIAAFNAKLPPYKTIKRFILLPREFSIEGGELTPTLKLKRKVICSMHENAIEQLYLNNNHGSSFRKEPNNGGKK